MRYEFEIKKLSGIYDLETMQMWFSEWGMPKANPEIFPENTYFILHKGKPVCGGSIYLTDSKVAFIESLVADPKSDKEVRDIALDLLINNIFTIAKNKGFKFWSATTKIDEVVRRGKKFKMTQFESKNYWMTGEL